MTSDSELTTLARSLARAFNDDAQRAKVKQVLLEMAHRIDLSNVRARKLGLRMTDGLGRSRYATPRECLAYWLTGALPPHL